MPSSSTKHRPRSKVRPSFGGEGCGGPVQTTAGTQCQLTLCSAAIFMWDGEVASTLKSQSSVELRLIVAVKAARAGR